MRPWRSWIARQTPTLKAAGSNPVGRTNAQRSTRLSGASLHFYNFLKLYIEAISVEKPIFGVTPLASLLKKTKLRVNSCHHQAIKTLAPGLVEMARSADDLIEVVYLCPARPSLGESSGIRRCPYMLMRPTGISLRRLLVLAKSNLTKGESTELGSVDSPF